MTASPFLPPREKGRGSLWKERETKRAEGEGGRVHRSLGGAVSPSCAICHKRRRRQTGGRGSLFWDRGGGKSVCEQAGGGRKRRKAAIRGVVLRTGGRLNSRFLLGGGFKPGLDDGRGVLVVFRRGLPEAGEAADLAAEAERPQAAAAEQCALGGHRKHHFSPRHKQAGSGNKHFLILKIQCFPYIYV